MEPFAFDYRLHRAGWATARIRLGARQVAFLVSYLRDSLRELASGVRALCEGACEVHVVFMDEPGEHHVVLRRAPESREVEVDVRGYSGYGGRGMRSDLLRGQVVSALTRTLETHGAAGYRALWRNADFPAEELAALRRFR